MNKVLKLISLLLIAVTLIGVGSGCASSKRGHCGCTGMIGYK